MIRIHGQYPVRFYRTRPGVCQIPGAGWQGESTETDICRIPGHGDTAIDEDMTSGQTLRLGACADSGTQPSCLNVDSCTRWTGAGSNAVLNAQRRAVDRTALVGTRDGGA